MKFTILALAFLLSSTVFAQSLSDVQFSFVGEELRACLFKEMTSQFPSHLSQESFPIQPLPDRINPPIFKRLGIDQGKEVVDKHRVSLGFLIESPSFGKRRSLYSIDLYSEDSEGWRIENRTHGFPGVTRTAKMSLIGDLYKISPGRSLGRIDLSECAEHFFGPVIKF